MGKLKALPGRLAVAKPALRFIPTGEKGRAEAAPWRAWYGLKRWRDLRLATFQRDRFTCQWTGCGRVEGNLSLLVADHRTPHRGDQALFWDPLNLQTLCKPCHDKHKQRAEIRGRL